MTRVPPAGVDDVIRAAVETTLAKKIADYATTVLTPEPPVFCATDRLEVSHNRRLGISFCPVHGTGCDLYFVASPAAEARRRRAP